jgi:hypothetical protein
MVEKSRIKFNPATKEIEIEGTEAFVKKYFDAVRNMIAEKPARPEKPARKAPAKTSPKAAVKKKGKKSTNTDTILNLIKESKGGLTTPDLKKKTGLADKQIWPIIYKAEKVRKIKKAGRGLYVALS